MRIIAGSRARTVLLPPEGMTTRPITDRVKENLFNILMPVVEGAVVADLFCGTGSLGLEALSRGAALAVMADNDRSALERLRKNVEKCRFEEQCRIFKADIFKTGIPGGLGVSPKIEELGPEAQATLCNLVFVDPPYRFAVQTGRDSQLGLLLQKIAGQVSDRGLVVVRNERGDELQGQYGSLHQQDRREYGGMALTFFENLQ